MVLLNIKVDTIPNGYTLVVGKEHYMYYNIHDLLVGLMYHAGLDEVGCIDRTTMEDFLAAAVVWRADDGNTGREMIRLKKENDALRLANANYQKRIKYLARKVGGSQSATDGDVDDVVDNDE